MEASTFVSSASAHVQIIYGTPVHVPTWQMCKYLAANHIFSSTSFIREAHVYRRMGMHQSRDGAKSNSLPNSVLYFRSRNPILSMISSGSLAQSIARDNPS